MVSPVVFSASTSAFTVSVIIGGVTSGWTAAGVGARDVVTEAGLRESRFDGSAAALGGLPSRYDTEYLGLNPPAALKDPRRPPLASSLSHVCRLMDGFRGEEEDAFLADDDVFLGEVDAPTLFDGECDNIGVAGPTAGVCTFADNVAAVERGFMRTDIFVLRISGLPSIDLRGPFDGQRRFGGLAEDEED